MSKIASKYVNWKVLFDGVEIPWINFTIGVGVDFPGQAGIVLEPDPMLNEMRPRTNVTILFYDNHEEGTDDLDKFKVYWEGEIEGYSYTKLAQGRSVTVNAEGQFSLFGRSRAFAHGFGPISVTPHVSGSLFAGTEAGTTTGQLFSFAIFGRAMDPENRSDTFSMSGDAAYGDRILSLLAFLSGYNANFRMQAVRTRLFGKIASVPDETVGKLVPRAMVSQYGQQMTEGQLPPRATLADIVGMFNQIAFHHYASCVAPKVPVGNNLTKPVYLPGSTADDSIYAMPRPYRRNDYIFMPELYYAVPPSCNFIFPEFIQSLSVSRSFSAEPTRALMMDQGLGGGNLAVVSPDEILRFEGKNPDPAQFWSLNRDGVKVEGMSESPYYSRSPTGQSFNLFGAVTDNEIEKGILPIDEETLPFEYFSAVSNVFDVSKKTLDDLASKTDTLEKLLAKIMKDSSRQSGYLYLVKALADHLLYMRRFRRAVTAELVGHRWIVPGFPCVIFDTMMSYIGYVRAVTIAVDANGAETTSLNLDYVRTFPKTSGQVFKDDSIKLAMKSMEESAQAFDTYKNDTENQGKKVTAAGTEMLNSMIEGKILGIQSYNLFNKSFGEVIEIVSKDENRAKRLGTSREAAIQLERSVDKALSDYVHKEEARTDRFIVGAISSSSTEAAAMRSAITLLNAYYADCVDLAKTASDSYDESLVSPTPGVTSSDPLARALKNTDLKGLFPEDFFAPPVFGNMNFIKVAEAEKLYENLIGSRPVLTPLAKDAPTQIDAGSSSASRVFTARLNSYNQFVNLTKALQKIFPIFGTEANSEWSTESRNVNRDSLSVREWAERKYLRRTGLMSLRQYAEKNLLSVTTKNSVTPVPQPFLVLAPSGAPKPVASKKLNGAKLTWDDSLYSKIVDEFVISPRDYTVKKTDGSVDRKSGVPEDPTGVIAELRMSVGMPELTTAVRQAFWVSYAENHHGSRAFVGR